jgi:putative transposase
MSDQSEQTILRKALEALDPALKGVEFDKTALSEALRAIPWPACGVMDDLVVDNGLDLTSNGVQDACTALGINLHFTPPRSPWYKGTIERAGGTFNTRFIHWIPGTTLGEATADRQYNAGDHAVLSDDHFELLTQVYIRLIHNFTPRREKVGSGVRRYLNGIAEWPVRVPTSMDELDAACALTRTATLRATGLIFLGLQYQNDELGELWNRVSAGTRLTFKVNPLNLKTIKVLKPVTQEIISVDCVSDFAWPRTLSYHLAVRQQARNMGVSEVDPVGLSQAERALKVLLDKAVATSKKALRRMQAELYRQSRAAEDAEASGEAAATVAATNLDDALSQAFGAEA